MRKAVELAKAGDVVMLKFLLGRILPRRAAFGAIFDFNALAGSTECTAATFVTRTPG